MEIWRRRLLADEDLDFENEEITLTEARKLNLISKSVKMFLKKLIDLGRRAILALRQNLISKIHEHDNTNLYKQFKDLIGEIYTAEVHHVRPRVVILVDDEGNEIVLPKRNKYLLIFP
jgi:N utilization substance protein A